MASEEQTQPPNGAPPPERTGSSLAQRLMALDPTVKAPAPEVTSPPVATAGPAVERPPEHLLARPQEPASETIAPRAPEPRAPRHNVRDAWRITPPLPEGALEEARTYVRVAYLIFLGSVAVFALLSLLSALFFLGAIVGGSDWQDVAARGAFLGCSLLLLLFVQYRPPRGFADAGRQITQLESTRAEVNKSVEFWERYLAERAAEHSLSSQDVTIAVSSLAEAAKSVIALEPVVVKSPKAPKATKGEKGEPVSAPAPPTVTPSPPPSRYQ